MKHKRKIGPIHQCRYREHNQGTKERLDRFTNVAIASLKETQLFKPSSTSKKPRNPSIQISKNVPRHLHKRKIGPVHQCRYRLSKKPNYLNPSPPHQEPSGTLPSPPHLPQEPINSNVKKCASSSTSKKPNYLNPSPPHLPQRNPGTLQFKYQKMCLGDNNPYQCSVFWYEDENLVHFRYPLPSGAKQADVKVEIDEDGNLLTVFLSFPTKKEEDTTTPIISMKFNLPPDLDLAGFKTAVDDAGGLTVTFTKLKPEKPEKKKPMPSPKKLLGWLLKAVPVCSIGSNMCHEMSSGGY